MSTMISLSLSLHNPVRMVAENPGKTFSSLALIGEDGKSIAIFMPYAVAEATARAFNEAMAAVELAEGGVA